MRLFISFFLICTFFIISANAAEAKELYRKCAGCHGKDAKHRPYERDSGVLHGRSQEELKYIMTAIRDGAYKDDKINKIMRKAIKNFSNDDIEAVSSYISKL